MDILKFKHTNDVLEDLRKIFSENSHSLVILSSSVFSILKQSSGIFQTDRTFKEVDNYKQYNIVSLEKSRSNGLWGKRTDIIGLTSITSNTYIIFYFSSVYVNSKPIHISKDKSKRIVYLE